MIYHIRFLLIAACPLMSPPTVTLGHTLRREFASSGLGSCLGQRCMIFVWFLTHILPVKVSIKSVSYLLFIMND